MENIKGKIQVGDKKITLETFDGEKEVWIKKISPEYERGIRFVRFRGQNFFKK